MKKIIIIVDALGKIFMMYISGWKKSFMDMWKQEKLLKGKTNFD